MNTQLKSSAAALSLLGLLVTFSGCASSPVRQPTFETGTHFMRANEVPTNIQAPVAERTVAPHYPDAMRRAGVDGVVNVYCLIDETGKVKEAKVVDYTDHAFAEPALDAMWKWLFKPGHRDGVAVPMRISVPVRFSISDQ
jgi:TonB family protein